VYYDLMPETRFRRQGMLGMVMGDVDGQGVRRLLNDPVGALAGARCSAVMTR